ncbi:hypothetical protein PHET_04828 [Paragonimus heterotremus]|uniref:Uncharacterized protein n=1 Tax=Paragonimus heterotremus TaxID=100268 RepID=A0A8J4TF05_9TREM|nr:hypothetical protein PHET_04828 [Paragonimus heterotremus]
METDCNDLKARSPNSWHDDTIVYCRQLANDNTTLGVEVTYAISVDVTRFPSDGNTLSYADLAWLTNNELNKQSPHCATSTYRERINDPECEFPVSVGTE